MSSVQCVTIRTLLALDLPSIGRSQLTKSLRPIPLVLTLTVEKGDAQETRFPMVDVSVKSGLFWVSLPPASVTQWGDGIFKIMNTKFYLRHCSIIIFEPNSQQFCTVQALDERPSGSEVPPSQRTVSCACGQASFYEGLIIHPILNFPSVARGSWGVALVIEHHGCLVFATSDRKGVSETLCMGFSPCG
jgi:hypothetical protein